MTLQRISLLPLLSRCPLLARRHLASGILYTCSHNTIATVPHTRNVLLNEWQNHSDHKSLQRRNFYSYFRKRKSMEEIREGDKIESHYELVYNAHSTSYVQWALGGVQAVIGGVSLSLGAALCGFPMLYTTVIAEEPIQAGVFITVNAMICFGILRICRWYPFRIYYSEKEDNFIVIFVGVHPFTVRHIRVLPGEVKPSPPGRIVGTLAPWSHHLYSTPTQTIHLNAEHFKYPFYYNKLLGYVPESD